MKILDTRGLLGLRPKPCRGYPHGASGQGPSCYRCHFPDKVWCYCSRCDETRQVGCDFSRHADSGAIKQGARCGSGWQDMEWRYMASQPRAPTVEHTGAQHGEYPRAHTSQCRVLCLPRFSMADRVRLLFWLGEISHPISQRRLQTLLGIDRRVGPYYKREGLG
jgi:hypothetical protein